MRLIDADKLFETIKEYIVDPAMVGSVHPDDVVQYNAGLLAAMGLVEESCTIDSVKRGRWIEREEWFDGETKLRKTFGCSECGHSMYSKHDTLNFCPRCGSRNEVKE